MRHHVAVQLLKVESDSLQPMDSSMLGFPVLHHFPDFAQTHVRWVSDAIQPSHPLSSPSPPALNLSQHQSLFQWCSLHQAAKELEFPFQHQSFQWIFRVDFLWAWLVWSCCSKDSPYWKMITATDSGFIRQLTLLHFSDETEALG